VDAQIVYTEPKPFNRRRFLLRLATVAAVVLALVLGMSIFFKVETINVAGVGKYTEWDVRQASGIADGETLLSLNKARISSNIMAALPYVETVRIGIELPGTVYIQITERTVVYAVQSIDESWWLVNSDGVVAEKTNAAEAEDHTRILGVLIENPEVGKTAVAHEEQASAGPDTEPVTEYNWERLDAAVSIAQQLEAAGILGQIVTIDVSDLGDLEMWYGTRFQIYLGDHTNLHTKIRAVKSAIDQMDDYQAGRLDASFTTWPTQVEFKSFE
jgi:cell division protein FtsQ